MRVVKFVQDGCVPCTTLTNILNTIGVKVEEVKITKENREKIATKYNIMGTPTMIAFDEDGNEIKRMNGASYSHAKEFFGL